MSLWKPVFRIRIQIFGLPDPDPLVTGTDPDLHTSIIKQKQWLFISDNFLLALEGHWRKKQHPDPDLLVRGVDPWIRSRTKMSQIQNTSLDAYDWLRSCIFLYIFSLVPQKGKYPTRRWSCCKLEVTVTMEKGDWAFPAQLLSSCILTRGHPTPSSTVSKCKPNLCPHRRGFSFP